MIDWEDINFPPINLWNIPQDGLEQNLQARTNNLDADMKHNNH